MEYLTQENLELFKIVFGYMLAFTTALWAFYERHGKLTLKDVVKVFVHVVQVHSDETGDTVVKDKIKRHNNEDVNTVVAEAKKDLGHSKK